MATIEKLLDVMRQLRDPLRGCPWDLEQDFSTIAPYTIEEAYEVADSIEREAWGELPDELGDLLFQVVFYAQMGQEKEYFDFDDIVACITDKMIRRHPHVFGGGEQTDANAVRRRWEDIKEQERAGHDDRSALAGVARALPALKRAQKLGKRAARVGFDWDERRGVHDKIREEFDELEAAADEMGMAEVEEELGDLLFAVVNLARHLDIDPEKALSGANAKFERRFRALEAALEADGRAMDAASLDTLERYWQEVKKSAG
ncbi:MAG: nucleoside triphosphate pyrophosphohydrolase [Gammaproteobacteria bacterium]|nr:nucleoside triphosphate pyrophosphohydrolase [Gammaproteobacteria bacterium]